LGETPKRHISLAMVPEAPAAELESEYVKEKSAPAATRLIFREKNLLPGCHLRAKGRKHFAPILARIRAI
jgi:hypothetical protein